MKLIALVNVLGRSARDGEERQLNCSLECIGKNSAGRLGALPDIELHPVLAPL